MECIKLVFSVLLAAIPCCIFATDKDSLIVKGYYLERFYKNEIQDLYCQKRNMLEGKSCNIPVDVTTYKIFFPTLIGKEKKDIFPNITFDISANNNDSLYIIPDRNNIKILKTSGLASNANLASYCILSCGIDFSPYYIFGNDDRFLYKCLYIEGYVKHINIHSVPTEWQNYILDMFSNSSNVKNQELYVFNKIKNYNPYIDDYRFHIWIPNLTCTKE